jgi:hypothetical protein
MAYTYDLATPVGQVRLIIGDSLNSQGVAQFTDEELTSFLTTAAGSVPNAAVQALRTWSRRLASQPKQQIGDYTYDPAQQAKALMAVADALDREVDDELDDPVIGDCAGSLFIRM